MIWRLISSAFRRFVPGVYRDAVERVAAENGLTPEQIERLMERP